MTVISDVKTSPKDFVRSLRGGNFHQAAKNRGLSVRQLLREEFGTLATAEGLTPLGLLMWQSDLVPWTNEAEGVRASTYEEFANLGPGGMFLMHEFLRGLADAAARPGIAAARKRAEAEDAGDSLGTDAARAPGAPAGTRHGGVRSSMFGSADQPFGTPYAPYTFDYTPYVTQIAPQIPLETVVARTVGIAGGAIQTFFVNDAAADRRMVRIAQGANIPLTRISGSNRTITLKKYGRAIELTYEVLRWSPIDLIGLLVQRIAVQAVSDQVSAAINVAVNGDGNASTAATNYNLTALDTTTTANNLTVTAWESFKLKFLNPYVLTTVLANEGAILKLSLLNLGSANIPLAYFNQSQGFGGISIVNPQLREPVAVGVSADAPSGVLVGLDARFALAHVTGDGGDIQETDRFIERQTEIMTMSYLDEFMVIDPNAAKTLTLTA